MPIKKRYDVCVVGAGSGGIGAAIRAAEAGATVALIEPQDSIGGNCTLGGVNAWEPVAGGAGLSRKAYDLLLKIPSAVGLLRQWHPWEAEKPFDQWEVCGETDFGLTCRRRGGLPIIFEPSDLQAVFMEIIDQAGDIDLLFETRVTGCLLDGRKVVEVETEGSEGSGSVAASVFVDSTAGVYLCRMAGCETMLGEESHNRFAEPSAKRGQQNRLNGATQVYRVTHTDKETITPLPDGLGDVPLGDTHWISARVNEYPCGDLNINAVSLFDGWEAHTLGTEKQKDGWRLGRRLAMAHWHISQTRFGFDGYRLKELFPLMGVREGHRVVGDYVLTETDVHKGIARQTHPDIITISDHAIDQHNTNRPLGELDQPFGTPYRCLVPKGTSNLLVACRGFSTSHIAAATCRLSRTMMSLGEAAGFAAAQAVSQDGDVRKVDISALKQSLTDGGVDLIG